MIVSFIFAMLLPEVTILFEAFAGQILFGIVAAINNVLKNIRIDEFFGYSFYFVLGYILHNKKLNKKEQNYSYVIGILGFLLTATLTLLATAKLDVTFSKFYSYLRVNVLMESIGIFIFFKYNCTKNKYMLRIINEISKYSFGIYLVHLLILEGLNKYCGIDTMIFNPIFSVPAITMIVFGTSLICMFILKKIPIVKNILGN